jgi:nucleoside-diphosphate-sugar epimerase
VKIFILGANGFIGNSLVEHLLEKTSHTISALDLRQNNLENSLSHSNFHFKQGSLLEEQSWIEEQIKQADVIVPLAAIATPGTYVTDPIRIFELDFEANLALVRLCVKHQKRVIFPSTSEVYGMCPDQIFDEETSNCVTGPIQKERWIYSCSKQMMDRIIFAYGSRNGLPYTLFRPFNWMGPKLDNILNPNPAGSRAVTQFIGNILRGQSITLVDGGKQRRSFIDIDDGISALLKIIENKNNCAHQKIFNIGNPDNDISIRELAELLISLIKTYPKYKDLAEKTELLNVSGEEHFGKGYQDVAHRVPSITRAKTELNWTPVVDIKTSLKKTLDYHLGN